MSLSSYVKTSPFNHQKIAYSRMVKKSSFGLFMEPGTGKTLPTIGYMGRKFESKGIRRAMIVCPSTAITEWELQLAQHPAFEFELVVLKGKAKKRRELWANHVTKPYVPTVVLMTYENMRIMEPEFKLWKPEMMILDESQHIKNSRSKQSKSAHRLGKLARYRIIMTGTPYHESPLDIYSQFKFAKPDLFEGSYTHFRDTYAILDFMGYNVKRYKDLDQLAERVRPHIYAKRKAECLDLPPYSDRMIKVEMNDAQARAYRQVTKDFILETADNEILPLPLVITRLIKAQQVTGGFTKNEDSILRLGSSKIIALEEVIDSIPPQEKIIVFCKFIEEIKQVRELLDRMKLTHVSLYGGTPDKGKVIRDFQVEKTKRVIIAQIKTGGASVTLTESNHTIYFSKSHSYLDYDQSRARNYRPGQTKRVTYYHLLCEGSVDELIHQAVESKMSQAEVMNSYLKLLGVKTHV